MQKPKLTAAYLVTFFGKKHCSQCKQIFLERNKEQLRKVFAEHVKAEHSSEAAAAATSR